MKSINAILMGVVAWLFLITAPAMAAPVVAKGTPNQYVTPGGAVAGAGVENIVGVDAASGYACLIGSSSTCGLPSSSSSSNPTTVQITDGAGNIINPAGPQVVQGSTAANNAPSGTIYPIMMGGIAGNGTAPNFNSGGLAYFQTDLHGAMRTVTNINSSQTAVSGGTATGAFAATSVAADDMRAELYGIDSSANFDRIMVDSGNISSGAAPIAAAINYSNQAINGVAPIESTSAVASIPVCTAACNVFGFNVVNGAAAGALVLIDAVSAPTTGSTIVPKYCLLLTANQSLSTPPPVPIRVSTGATLLISSGATNAACGTFVAGATAIMGAQVKQ